jgi:hypothetical protein
VELVDFLRARLDEDEALAMEAPPGPWHIGNAVDPTQPCNVHTFPGARLVADDLNWLVAEHIARYNPARVLREIEAKREALAHYERIRQHARQGEEVYVLAEGAVAKQIAIMATAYSDRPGYREDWRP